MTCDQARDEVPGLIHIEEADDDCKDCRRRFIQASIDRGEGVGTCYNPGMIIQLLDGTMAAGLVPEMQDHIRQCGQCAEQYVLGQKDFEMCVDDVSFAAFAEDNLSSECDEFLVCEVDECSECDTKFRNFVDEAYGNDKDIMPQLVRELYEKLEEADE